jgi:segregation and condensation protein A
MSTYTLKTEVFEGPLDLLLALIEKRKLLINDISLADVADDYLKYLERHTDFPIAETAQFVLIGSALLLIKSRSLLPVLSLTPEEQTSIEDLELRLKLLELFQRCARSLVERYGVTPCYGRVRSVRTIITFSPDANTTLTALQASARAVLRALPVGTPKLSEATVRKVVSIEEMMTSLTQRLNAGMQVTFREARGAQREENKLNTIVLFLAMLELVRQGMIRVEQEAVHGDIVMRSDTIGVPVYG